MPQVPARVWRDWVLVGFVVVAAVLEGLIRTELPWRPLATAATIGLAFTLPWRRTQPLAMVAIAFGVAIALDLASIVAGLSGSVGLGTTAFVLVLIYALYRWGSGRQIVLGSAIVLVACVVGISRDYTGLGDLVGASVVVTFPAVLGSSIRLVRSARERELDQVRLREREQLARELHDTVAHHVSAMVVRAQAGQVVGASSPDAALEALEVIEAEGSRTLAEMRVMVRALRERDEAELAPARGVADIAQLVRGDGPPVDVQLTGDLDELGPSVGAAIYRIAQESLTNAVRHAQHPSGIVVRVAGEPDFVRLTVTDDGESVPSSRTSFGYGIVGMTERAALLGGTLDVGPGPDRGWVVDAVLPRMGAG